MFSQIKNQEYFLRVRTPKIEARPGYHGSIIYPDNVVGTIVAWQKPGAQQTDLDKLNFAIQNHKNYQSLVKEYIWIIQTSPFVKWSLIPLLLGAKIESLPLMPNHIKNNIKLNKDFFHFLVQQGAIYKPYLAGAYGIPSLEVFNSLLHLFGIEANIPEKGTLNLMQLILTSHLDDTSFNKMKTLVTAGANINERVGDEFQNTILHYLIALEHNTPVVLDLIEFMEKISACNFDYTLQDKFGKTPLLLAVGLNDKPIVEKLLSLTKKKKNIGLNIPDIEGRTPCMIAAALGHLDILKLLIQAGANCYTKDNQGRDLLQYANCSIEEVRTILVSFSIHPGRIASANHSYLYSSTREAYPVVLVEKQTGKEHLLLLSREEPYFGFLKIALNLSLNNQDPGLAHDYFKKQTSTFINKSVESILQAKVRNQIPTRQYIKEVLFRFACAFGDMETVQHIGNEANFNFISCDHFTRTAMHFSVMSKAILEDLIQSAGYFRNATDCLKDHPKVFKYLMEKNTEFLDIKNIKNNTPRSILQRDTNNEDKDTQEQAKIMFNLMEEYLSSNRNNFSM